MKKETHQGVLPILEEHLLNARKAVKKLMKTEKNPDVYAMLNAKQLAIKISCNSVYGFTGASYGMYSEQDIAETITCTGREWIDKSKHFVQDTYANSVVIAGDTDSMFIRFDVPATQEGLVRCFELGRETGRKMSEILGDSVTLEMEKVYFPFLLFGKKRYAGLKYEEPEKAKELDTKGIEVVRRDWSELVRHIYRKCLNKVFYDRDVNGAKELLKTYCQNMIDKKLEFKWFVMSKELKSKYTFPDRQLHYNVVQKIAKRSPGMEPQVGDRVPFVIVRIPNQNKHTKTSEKSEDPDHVIAQKVPLDYEYYLDKQIMTPMVKFFGPFMDNPEELFVDVKRQLHNEYNGFGRNGLMSYFNVTSSPKVQSPQCKPSVEHDVEPGTDPIVEPRVEPSVNPSVECLKKNEPKTDIFDDMDMVFSNPIKIGVNRVENLPSTGKRNGRPPSVTQKRKKTVTQPSTHSFKTLDDFF